MTSNQVTEIMNNFNFQKVWRVMEFLNWQWAFAENGVPSVSEIRKLAERLLKQVDAEYESNGIISTGGFWAEKRNGELSLMFVLENWEA